MSKKIKMTIEMDVTEPQALALQAMFEYWNSLASLGSSRYVAFYVDGDGDFKPNCNIVYSTDKMPELVNEIRDAAVMEDVYGHRKYDYDNVAWKLDELKDEGKGKGE